MEKWKEKQLQEFRKNLLPQYEVKEDEKTVIETYKTENKALLETLQVKLTELIQKKTYYQKRIYYLKTANQKNKSLYYENKINIFEGKIKSVQKKIEKIKSILD